MNLPRFLVITPAYNPSEQYLQECIDSVNSQVSSKYSIIHAIIFNGPEKSSFKYHTNILKASPNYQLAFLDIAPIKGVSTARNTALSSFSFDFCAFLDSDDVWPLGYLHQLFDITQLILPSMQSLANLNCFRKQDVAPGLPI